ncbi:hypothetical protein FRX31_031594 [Thalictrum thalictroides]|uniref:Uncharacterized protein n=1 Tax=Thalictrum thalictroides TaxID=46969 RepID=A0A7J6V3J3_THATH|nr:hypothetical protein FRX31_031594 [Thalictrum thalictroides]
MAFTASMNIYNGFAIWLVEQTHHPEFNSSALIKEIHYIAIYRKLPCYCSCDRGSFVEKYLENGLMV